MAKVDQLVHIISGDLWAGAEVQVFNLVVALYRQNLPVYVILFNHGELEERLQEIGISINVIDETKYNILSLCKRTRQVLRKINPRVIHSHGYKEGIVAAIANSLSVRVATVRTEHGNPEFSVPWRKLHRYLQHKTNIFIAKFINKAVIAVSQQLKQAIEARLSIKHVVLIENAIDIDRVTTLSEKKIMQYSKQEFKIACVGRLVPLKRQDLLIELMTHLQGRAGVRCKLYLFGTGPKKEALQNLVAAYGAGEIISFEGEVVPLYPCLKQMDVLVIPSDHEGLPMTLLETMTLKIPVVAHAVGGIPQVLQNGKYGRLVKDHSVNGYLDALLEVINNIDEAKAKAEAAYHYIVQDYNIDRKVQEYLSLYEKVSR